MLTFIGYAPAVWLFALGGIGLVYGVIPGFTLRRTPGLRVPLAALILMSALPLMIWLGYRSTEVDDLKQRLTELEQARQFTSELAVQTLETAEKNPASETSVRLRRDLEEQKKQATQLADDLQKKLEALEAYERLFQRLFFTIAVVLIAQQVIPLAAKLPPRYSPAQAVLQDTTE